MSFMAAYRNLERMFNQGKLNVLIPGALSAIRHVREEFQKVIDESVRRKHRAERAEESLERQQNENYRLAAELERANTRLAEAQHRLRCVLHVRLRHLPDDAEPPCEDEGCPNAGTAHVCVSGPAPATSAKPEASLADKISAYAAHLEDRHLPTGHPAKTHKMIDAQVEELKRAALARELSAIIFRAEEHAKRG